VSPELKDMQNEEPGRIEIEEDMDPGNKSLAEALRISFFVLKIGIAIVILWFLASGVFIVGVNEAAVKLRFGRIVGTKADRIIKKGIHWAWPSPIDEIVKFPVEKLEVIRLSSFWYEASPEEIKEGRQQRLGKVGFTKGYTLTGDLNILHSTWEIYYKISDPVKYLTKMYVESPLEYEQKTKEIVERRRDFMQRVRRHEIAPGERLDIRIERATRNVEDFVRASLCNAIIKESAGFKVDDALFGEREEFKNRVEGWLKKRFDELDCGLEVSRVALKETKYPPEVADAFLMASEADNLKDNLRKSARALAGKILTEAEGEKAAMVSAARTYKTKVVKSAEADAKYIEYLLALSDGPGNPQDLVHFLNQHYQQVILETLANAEEMFIFPAAREGEKKQLRVRVPRDERIRREKIKKVFE